MSTAPILDAYCAALCRQLRALGWTESDVQRELRTVRKTLSPSAIEEAPANCREQRPAVERHGLETVCVVTVRPVVGNTTEGESNL